ncbi:hypothetical protein [Paenirhodobacter enshiensis]|uniref:hypothetical protein n=1 Tax=Paenirhodobacter enshiensis TaxID=1105367 RepID=UPI00126820C2|nr:hypothetical protein [Paenirhodobacter enshiensis]
MSDRSCRLGCASHPRLPLPASMSVEPDRAAQGKGVAPDRCRSFARAKGRLMDISAAVNHFNQKIAKFYKMVASTGAGLFSVPVPDCGTARDGSCDD